MDKSKKILLICVGLSLLVAPIYWRTFDFGFVDFDDGPYVIDNPCIQDGFTWKGIKCSLTTLVGGNWCPPISLSYMLDYELYGEIKPALDDGPECNICGSITVNIEGIYKCLNCGNSMGQRK